LNWLLVSPAAFFVSAGKRTGKYKTSDDNLIMDSKNESYIFYAGYFIAVVDEIEYPKHFNTTGFAVGSV
jgi:putative NADH-flavin reductase